MLRRTKLSLLVAVLVFAVGAPAGAGDGSAELSLPWGEGETWTLISGAHSYTGAASPPSSLDFFGGSGRVRAAGAGVVYRDGNCAPSFVRIDHQNGWQTSYYHLENIVVEDGQRVDRGALLGHAGTGTACGGTATEPHVHFTLWRFSGEFRFGADQESSLVGVDIGGWTVSSEGHRHACMRRISDGHTQCSPNGQIHNDGSVGSGEGAPPESLPPLPLPLFP